MDTERLASDEKAQHTGSSAYLLYTVEQRGKVTTHIRSKAENYIQINKARLLFLT